MRANGAVDGAVMSAGLDRIGWGRFRWTGINLSHRGVGTQARLSRARFVVLPLALVVAAGGGLVMSGSRGGVAEPKMAQPAAALAPTPESEPATGNASYDPLTAEAITPDQPTPMDRLKISSQAWRRGGLGSNALVSFTVRNNNDYAVKDLAISCAFTRRDGSHLTDRTRAVPGIIEMRSRKTFAHMHIGFVNVNANKAKCALVSASRT